MEASEHDTLVEAAHQFPKGVVCLLSALRFHNFTTQSPREVWIAIGQKSWAPKASPSSVRLVRMSGQALDFGIREHKIAGTIVRVFSPAKTVADCFKFRNKIGLDVALEALKESRRTKKATMDEIWNAAKVCRVANVMRPYLESLKLSHITRCTAPRPFVYPKETVVSEKFEAVVSLGIANTRMKDFYDLEVLSAGSRLEAKFSRKQSAKPLRIAGPTCLKQALRSLSGGILLIAAICDISTIALANFHPPIGAP
jgi:hypothetical protein